MSLALRVLSGGLLQQQGHSDTSELLEALRVIDLLMSVVVMQKGLGMASPRA